MDYFWWKFYYQRKTVCVFRVFKLAGFKLLPEAALTIMNGMLSKAAGAPKNFGMPWCISYPGEGRARCSVDSPDPGLMTTRSLAGPEFRQAPSDAGSATVMSEVVRA